MRSTAALRALCAMLLAFLVFAPGSASATPADGLLCDGLSSSKIDTTGDPMTLTVTAPAGKLIDRYCVKAGSLVNGGGAKYFDVTPPAASITLSYTDDSGDRKAISHYSLHYVDVPVFDQCAELSGNQPAGTECSKDDTTRPVSDTRVNCDGHQSRSGVETTTYRWDGESWVANSPSTLWGDWTTTGPLSESESDELECVTETTDACDNLDGVQAEGTECSKDPTTAPVNDTRVTCAGHQSRSGVETTTYRWDGESWVANSPSTLWGDWTTTGPLSESESDELECVTETTDACDNLDGVQAEGTECSKDPTTAPANDTRVTCAGHQSRSGVETTTYRWDGESWVANSPSTLWGDWTTTGPLSESESDELECVTETTDACDELDGDQAEGTQCTHAPDVSRSSQSRTSCANGVETRTLTTTVTWGFIDGQWVAGSPVTDNPDWTFVRDLTDAEKAQLGCTVVEPPVEDACDNLDGVQGEDFPCEMPDVVTISDPERLDCEAGVESHQVTETTTYEFVDGAWVGTTTTETGPWTFVRDLTDAEKTELGCIFVDPPIVSPPVVKPPVVKPPVVKPPVVHPPVVSPPTQALPATGASAALSLFGALGVVLVLTGGGLVRRRPRHRA